MNILLCANEYAASGAEVVIYSLMRYNTNINWFVFTFSINLEDKEAGIIYTHKAVNQEQQTRLRKIVQCMDPNSNISFIDVAEVYDKYLAGSPNELTGFTPYTTLRLLADVCLPNVNDLLYLDLDTLVQDNIEYEYNKYTSADAPYSAYTIPEACYGDGEMVAGVLFLNMMKCREIDFFKQARQNYMRNEYVYPDQCAIRDVCKPNNIEESLNYMRSLEETTFNPKIIHFSNELKEKIYVVGKNAFYRRYPQFKDIKEGIEMIDGLDLKL